MLISFLPDILDGDHFGKLKSGGDLGDSDGVSRSLPDGSSSEGGESRGEGDCIIAGVVLARLRVGRFGEAAVGVLTLSSGGGGEGPWTCTSGTTRGELTTGDSVFWGESVDVVVPGANNKSDGNGLSGMLFGEYLGE